MSDSDFKSLEQFKLKFREMVVEMNNLSAYYASAALHFRTANLVGLAAMAGTGTGESFETLIQSARLSVAALDKSLEMMFEALLSRARELTQPN